MGFVLSAIGYVAGYLAILFQAICIGTSCCCSCARFEVGWAAQSTIHHRGIQTTLDPPTRTPPQHQQTACGLYYAAELAEEYASQTKRVIAWAVALVIALHCALVVEKFPLPLLAGGVGCHAVYACLLLDFPNVEVFSLKFGLSLCKCLCWGWGLGIGIWGGGGRGRPRGSVSFGFGGPGDGLADHGHHHHHHPH